MCIRDSHHPASAAVGNAGLGNLLVGDRVGSRNIAWTHDAADVEHAHLRVDAELLRAADHHVSIRQHVSDDRGDGKLDVLGTVDLAVALDLRIGVEVGIGLALVLPACNVHQPVQPELDLRIARATGLVVELGLVLHRNDHRHDVADAPGAGIAVEIRAIVPGRAIADGRAHAGCHRNRFGRRPQAAAHG